MKSDAQQQQRSCIDIETSSRMGLPKCPLESPFEICVCSRMPGCRARRVECAQAEQQIRARRWL